MDREGISGISKELDEALEQVAESRKPARIKAWKQPRELSEKENGEDGYFDEPDAEEAETQEAAATKIDIERPGAERTVGLSGLLRPSDSLLAAFFVPIILLVVIFALKGIFPFGTESFLRTDMYHQYAPFFSEFQHKLTEGGSLLYSWDIGMGVNFAALYAYYLASPLNWLLILCPKAYIIEFMTYMIVIKTGLC